MFIARVALAIGLSMGTLVLSFILDNIFSLMPYHTQFILQIPAIIIIMDEIRLLFIKHASKFHLTEEEIDGSFFFVAPMVSIGSITLFADLRRILPMIRIFN